MLLVYLRVFVISCWFFFCSFIILILSLFRPWYFGNATLFNRIVNQISMWILGINFELRHPERLYQYQPCVFIGNHQHTIDVFVYGKIFPRHTVTIGKKSIVWIPLFGWIYWLTGQILIDRANRSRAVGTLRFAADHLKKKRLSVLMFPEGTRSWNRGFGMFKKGAFHLALELQWPIVVIATSSFYKSVDFKKLRAGRIVVDVLEPIPTQGLGEDATDRLLKEAHQKMKDRIDALDRELAISGQ